jgi:hypothetical protein
MVAGLSLGISSSKRVPIAIHAPIENRAEKNYVPHVSFAARNDAASVDSSFCRCAERNLPLDSGFTKRRYRFALKAITLAYLIWIGLYFRSRA